MLDPTNQQREMVDGKVWARLRMQVGRRLGGVIERYSRGLWSLMVQAGGDAGQGEVESGGGGGGG